MRNAASFPLRSPQPVCSPAGSDGTPKGIIVTKISLNFSHFKLSKEFRLLNAVTKNYSLLFFTYCRKKWTCTYWYCFQIYTVSFLIIIQWSFQTTVFFIFLKYLKLLISFPQSSPSPPNLFCIESTYFPHPFFIDFFFFISSFLCSIISQDSYH